METQFDKRTAEELDLNRITDDLLRALDARSKDIVARRFGLRNGKKETLESIGKEYTITRERVRQIESNAKKHLSSQKDTFMPVYDFLLVLFKEHGGILAEQHAVELTKKHLQQDVSQNAVHFYLQILPHFTHVPSDSFFDPHWRHPELVQANVSHVVTCATEILKDQNKPLALPKLVSCIQEKIPAEHAASSDNQIYAVLIASKHISQTPFGDWGLIGWADTSPRGVGDKAYAVLRRHGKPAHFREITRLINETQFDRKKANPQTVHNELIKDSRFVLVGRGLYGLKEWGFVSGTVADVLQSILKDAEKPLTREELIEQVLKQRMVKKNTILLSLQNNKRFEKVDDNKYALKG